MEILKQKPGNDAGATEPKRKRGRPPKAEGADSGRRNALIATAARHFRDKGFDATTTRDIASATGMQSGSPFYHFKSKNALLVAIMEEGMLAAQRSQDAVLASLPQGVTARQTLGALVLSHLYVLWLPGNDFVPVMLHEWRSLTAAERKKIQALKDAYELSWRAVVEQLQAEGKLGVDASLARSMLFSNVHGTMHWFRPKGRLTLEWLAQECVNAMVAPDKKPPVVFDTVALVRTAVRKSWVGLAGVPDPVFPKLQAAPASEPPPVPARKRSSTRSSSR